MLTVDCGESSSVSHSPATPNVLMGPWMAAQRTPVSLAAFAHGDLKGIETPIGYIPHYEDLVELFSSIIDKEYPRELYDMQFSIYVDKILDRVNLQREAFGKEENLPERLFEVYDEWAEGLNALKEQFGSVVLPSQLVEVAV